VFGFSKGEFVEKTAAVLWQILRKAELKPTLALLNRSVKND
jgi:hypothetical protein